MKEFIEIGGKKYRAHICWNAVLMYLKEKGVEDLTKFGEIYSMSAEDVLRLMFWSMFYGEEMEGRELPIKSSHELGLMVSHKEVMEFVNIFAKQMTSQLPQQEEQTPAPEEVKKKRFFFRK